MSKSSLLYHIIFTYSITFQKGSLFAPDLDTNNVYCVYMYIIYQFKMS